MCLGSDSVKSKHQLWQGWKELFNGEEKWKEIKIIVKNTDI